MENNKLLDWLRRFVGSRTAVETRRENAVLRATVNQSGEIYSLIPLRELIKEEDSDVLAREL